jgi:putative aldouronate transport system permease protein
MVKEESNAEKGKGEIVFDVFNHAALILLVIVTLYPLVFVLMASVSNPLIVAQKKDLFLWPRGFTLNTYKYVFENPMITIGYKNTIIYVLSGTLINMVLTSLGAYALSRKYCVAVP